MSTVFKTQQLTDLFTCFGIVAVYGVAIPIVDVKLLHPAQHQLQTTTTWSLHHVIAAFLLKLALLTRTNEHFTATKPQTFV